MKFLPSPGTTPYHLGRLFLATLALAPEIRAIAFTSAPSPNLNLAQLGRLAIAGNFDSVSLYEYVGQDESGNSSNGGQALLGRYPSGTFTDLQSADAYIEALCPFVWRNGTLGGVIVGGNFTSLGGQDVQAMALYNPTTNTVEPVPGLTGQVYSVFCDNEQETVYVGGSFSGGYSTNAIAWTGGWANLPFSGFNGPVTSITKLPNGNVIFGGSFTSLGNSSTTTLTTPDAQIINIGSADITASGTTSKSDYANPRNIVCRPTNQTAAENEWLLADDTPGYWQANFGFGFEPSKLRLYNTQVTGYGTKTWRFVDQNSGGIMNFTYYGARGLASCTNECPLERNSSYQDFFFVNNYVGMNSFRIYIDHWYDRGGGLAGIELFQNDIGSFAIEAFNEPSCDAASQTASNVTTTGSWVVSPSGNSISEYLTASVPTGTVDGSDLSVVFLPDIQQSGNYTVTVYTPGCVNDDTCSTRGIVNITGEMGNLTETRSLNLSRQLYQTNNYDKYDQVYSGYVDAADSAFRPTITLTPGVGQKGPLTVVAQRVRFELVSSSSGLNGLYEFNPNLVKASTDFSASAIDFAGTQLDGGAQISTLAVAGNITYVAGDFTSNSYSNIMAIENGNATSLPGGGLNQAIQALYQNGSYLYAAGNFTNTNNNTMKGLNSIAAYSIPDKVWQPLGAGVNGIVYDIVPLNINISSTAVEECIAFSGYFDTVYGFGRRNSYSVNNIAVWVPSHKDWLPHVDSSTISISGRLTAQANVPGQGQLFAGSVNSQGLGTSGVVGLATSGNLALQQLPIAVNVSTEASSLAATRKRAVLNEDADGVVTGLFYDSNGLNVTVIGGHFSATATNGSQVANLAFINGTNNNRVTGLASDSSSDGAILAVASQGTLVFAGGSIANGIVVYDLASADLAPSQPPAISGETSTVNAIAVFSSSTSVYVGGSFTSAGSLPCPALCIYDTSTKQWTAPAAGLSDSSVITQLEWASSDRLILTGNMTIGSNYTTMASYSPKSQVYSFFPQAGDPASVPGQITAFTATDDTYTSFFAAGISSSSGTTFLTRYDAANSTWTRVTGLSAASVVECMQVLSLSTSHANTALVSPAQSLLVGGRLQLQGYGNVSAALFNGSAFTPLLLSTRADGSPGTVRATFVQNTQNLFSTGSTHLATGFIVLISLAIALALIFLLVVAGILVERLRRRREGYLPAPTTIPPPTTTAPQMSEKPDKGAGGYVGAIPPEQLFGGFVAGGNANGGGGKGKLRL